MACHSIPKSPPSLVALLEVAHAAQHLQVVGHGVAAPGPRKPVIAVHFLELEVPAAVGALAALPLVCGALLRYFALFQTA